MISMNEVKDGILKIASRVNEIRDELTEIDSKLGDGDMGISMSKGAAAVVAAVEAYSGDDFKMLFMQSASALNKAAPSTMGTLLSGGLLACAKFTAGKSELSEADLIALPGIIAEAISTRGKAHVGDKTILDAMIPYADTLKVQIEAGADLATAKEAAFKAAAEGVESTKGMIAKTGRASWLGDRNKDCPDGGSYMFYRIAEIL